MTFADGAAGGGAGEVGKSALLPGSNNSGRSSKGSQLSSRGRARWSLPSDASGEDGLTISQRYAKRQQQIKEKKSTEELQIDAIKKQRQEK